MCNEDAKKKRRYSKIEKAWNYLNTETINVNINMKTTPSMCRTFWAVSEAVETISVERKHSAAFPRSASG